MILSIYLFFGMWSFFYEWNQGSSKKFALFIAIFYPVTMCAGAIGWVIFGIYNLIMWGYKCLKNLLSKRFSK